jgi:8-oxo-dGTP pyrophosphatase MutT (NUDIX family)
MRKSTKKWTKLSSRSILKHSKINIFEDQVRLPNGNVESYIRMALMQEAVIIIAINNKNQLLVQREYSYPPDTYMWQLPGGKIRRKETVIEAANRELAEESAFSAKKSEVIGYFYVQNRLTDQKQYVVICKDLYSNKLPPDSDEFIENFWLSSKKVGRMISDGEVVNINMLAALNLWEKKETIK